MFRYYGFILLSWFLLGLGILISGAGKVSVTPAATATFLFLAAASIGAVALAIRSLVPEERSSRAWEPIVGLVLVGGMGAIVVPVYYGSRGAPKRSVCIANGKQLGLAFQIYVSDFDEKLPPAVGWSSLLNPYTKKAAFKCPESKDAFDYGMNLALSQLKLPDLKDPAGTILIFECASDQESPVGGREAFIGRHN
jgi:hypothetical protein